MGTRKRITHMRAPFFAVAFLLGLEATHSFARCEIVEGEKRAPFDGKTLSRIWIEKKSLTLLNQEFPDLNVIERTFKGEIQTCTNCTEIYITCTR